MPVHAAPGAEAAKLDDSAHKMDMEKGGVPAGKGGQSARGSAEFLQEVESCRSIKARSLGFSNLKSF